MEDFLEDPYRNNDDNEDTENAVHLNPDDQNEDDKVLSDLEKLAKGAKKKHVLRPQPKLDVERLKSIKGLTALSTIFKDVEFKGEGYEFEDLNTLMLRTQHWAHRLMPKVTFSEFIERLEKLGTKKETQTLIKRIRLDMLPTEEQNAVEADEVKDNIDENIDDNIYRPDLDLVFGPEDSQRKSDSLFQDGTQNNGIRSPVDGLINNQFKVANHDNSLATNTPSLDTLEDSSFISSNSLDMTRGDSTPVAMNDSSLTESVKERIERNRLLALEKKKQRLSRSFV